MILPYYSAYAVDAIDDALFDFGIRPIDCFMIQFA